MKRATFLSAVLAVVVYGTSEPLWAQNLTDTPLVDERAALPFPPGVSLESVCGLVDDLQHVELYDGSLGVTQNYVNENEKSVVQFQWKSRDEIESRLGASSDAGNVGNVRWCSGTLFQKNDASGNMIDYVLTAAHCFESSEAGWFTPQKDGDTLEPKDNAQLMRVNLNYQINGESGALRKAIEYDVHALVENGLGGLDYAIVQLGPRSGGDSGHVKHYAKLKPRLIQGEEKLAIIQHPQGDPKKVEAGSLYGTTDIDAYYSNIDTHGGSSGSGVRDKNGDIVAVHTNGGCSHNGGANRGVLLKAISNVSSLL